RAVADVWLSPSRAARAAGGSDGEWGVTIRFPDPHADTWRSTGHGPRRGWVIPFTAGPGEPGSGDAIVLAGERDGVRLRWIFSDLMAGSFRWRAGARPAGRRPPARAGGAPPPAVWPRPPAGVWPGGTPPGSPAVTQTLTTTDQWLADF